MRYSATSVMLPELTMEEQAELLGRLGFDGIEWRVRRVPEEERGKGFSEWGEHKNDLTPENFAQSAPKMRQVAAERGLAIVGIASNAPADDIEQVKLLAEGAAACGTAASGAPFIRIGCPSGYDGSVDYHALYEEAVEAYGRALEAMAPFGVKAVLEIHGGTLHPSASLAHRIVSHWPPERVGVIYDPQNMVSDGYETTELALDLLGPYVAHVHVGGHRPVAKGVDEVGTRRWEWERVSMAEGLYDYPRLFKKLKAVNYQGYVSIEDFRSVRAEEKLREGIGYVRAIEAQL